VVRGEVGGLGLRVEGLGSGFRAQGLSHHSRFNVTCECNKEEINDDDDAQGLGLGVYR